MAKTHAALPKYTHYETPAVCSYVIGHSDQELTAAKDAAFVDGMISAVLIFVAILIMSFGLRLQLKPNS